MNKLYLTRDQAKALSSDLSEYVAIEDSSNREIFKGFEIRFGDLFGKEMQQGESLELTPIPDFLEVP